MALETTPEDMLHRMSLSQYTRAWVQLEVNAESYAVSQGPEARTVSHSMKKQGRIQENSKGRVMNWSGAPTYTQN